MQSDLSVENGLFRLKPKIGLSYTVENELFRLNFCRLSFPTGRPCRKILRVFFNPSHRSSHHKTHTNTSTHLYQVTQRYHTAAPTLPRLLSLLLLLVASQRGAFLAPLVSNVYRTMATASGIDAILPTTATPAVALVALG